MQLLHDTMTDMNTQSSDLAESVRQIQSRFSSLITCRGPRIDISSSYSSVHGHRERAVGAQYRGS